MHLDVARFLITTSCEAGIDQVLWVTINGSKVRLKLIQDAQAPLRIVSAARDVSSCGFFGGGFSDEEEEDVGNMVGGDEEVASTKAVGECVMEDGVTPVRAVEMGVVDINVEEQVLKSKPNICMDLAIGVEGAKKCFFLFLMKKGRRY